MNTCVAIAEEFRRYAYSVSHDVSAPVRAMVEFSKLLNAEDEMRLSADGREYLQIIIDNGKKLQCMMDALLQYSRLDTQTSSFEIVDLDEILNSILLQFTDRILSSDAQFEISPMPKVVGDYKQLSLLFMILIDNALVYRADDCRPYIKITVAPTTHGWKFSVADMGIGIAEAHKEKIFEIFKRLHTDEEYPGTGMGLALAKKIVSRHGGAISCEPNTPCGTIFIFDLSDTEA